MSASRTEVTLIIPTHNRRDALLRTLAALGEQSVPPSAFEVIVIADGCADGTAGALREREWPFPLRVSEQPGLGAAAARNRGAADARAPLLLFLDDDVVPAPGLVAAHRAAHPPGADRVVMGPYPPVIRGRGDLYRLIVREWWENQFHTMAEPGHRFTSRDLLTGNLSLTAALFRRVGGFDESIRSAGGEDWELGIRLVETGAEFVFLPGACADHYEDSDLDRSFRRARREGVADVVMGRRHPTCRATLPLAELNTDGGRLKRGLRYVAFRLPAIGDGAARCLRPALDRLERASMRRGWRRLMGALRYYWYWRGVADALGDAGAAARFVAGGTPPVGEPALELDLADGLSAAEDSIDRVRPRALRLRYGAIPIGSVDPLPAAEALRGAHLRPLLGRRFAEPLAVALALERLRADPGARHGD